MTLSSRRPRRVDATPIFDATIFGLLRWMMLKILIVLVAPVLALMWFGQPALRMVYWYHGTYDHPLFERCQYIALDGWHYIMPGRNNLSDSECPIVTVIPVDFPKLIGGLLRK